MTVTLAELARRFQARLQGAGDVKITGAAALERAEPGQISYVNDARHRRQLGTTRASALILTEADTKEYAGNALIVDRPQLCFARVAAFLHPATPMRPGIDQRAIVDAQARVSARARIGPFAVVEAGAVIAEDVEIGAGSHIGRDAEVGAGTRLIGQVWIGERCVMGRRCVVQPGAVIGGDGFGFAKDGEQWVKIPQLGRVVIGDDVEIGANTTIDRGTLNDTEIGNGVKLDNLVQIAHNVKIGEHTAMAACVGVAGSSIIGRRCTFGGQVGIADHVTIVDDVHVLGTSLVAASITEAGTYSSAIPADRAGEWRRQAARLRRLDELVERVKDLEEKIGKFKEDYT